MKKRFFIAEMYICTFDFEDEFIKPSYGPTRTCVIDDEKGIVIDIEHNLKYDYIKTMNGTFISSDSIRKLKEGKRAAIIPIDPIDIPSDKRILAYDIIKKLESGEEFKDGNEVLSNDEYLASLKDKSIKSKTFSKVIKKCIKK